MKFALPTHPETPTHLLRQSFLLYRHSWLQLFYLSLLLSITAFLPSLFSLLIGENIFINMPILSLNRLWLFALNLVGIVFFVAILWRIHCLLIHKHESLEEDLKIGVFKILHILIAWFLQSVLMVGSIILFAWLTYYVILDQHLDFSVNNWRSYLAIIYFFIEFGFLVFVFLSFYFYLALIVLEDKGPLAALSKSFRLVWNHWQATIYVQIVPWLTYFLTLFVVRFIIHRFPQQIVLEVLLQILLFAIFVPWIAITLMVQLKDLELRQLPRFQNE